MKIAAIATSRVPSDTANSIQVMKAAQALAELGHTPTLLLPGEPGQPNWDDLAARYGLRARFPIEWLPCHPRLKRNDFAWRAARRARALGADVVYSWAPQSAVWALSAGLPVILELHDLPTGRLGPLWYRLFRAWPGRKRLASITHALAERLARRYGALTEAQTAIAPNGVDLEQYANLPEAPAARAALGLAEGVTVLCAGHLYAGRGADLFLDLAERFAWARFVWVGGRPADVAEWEERARARGIANTRFTGFAPNAELPLFQAAADVLLMPYGRSIAGSSGGNSAEICSPMKMFDYMAAGRAILTADLPAVHEVLDDTMAVFAEPEDRPAWQAALGGLLADPDRRARLAENARRAAQNYSWKTRAAHILNGF